MIIEQTNMQLHKYNFNKISMDNIARELGISKKTIYKVFKNKDDLIYSCCRQKMEHMEEELKKIVYNDQIPFKNKLKSFLLTALDKNKLCTSEQLTYLSVNHPDIMNEIADFNRFCENTLFDKILEEGRSQGLINRDLDNKTIIRVFINSLKDIIIYTNNDDFEKSLDFFNNIFEIMIKGISKNKLLMC